LGSNDRGVAPKDDLTENPARWAGLGKWPGALPLRTVIQIRKTPSSRPTSFTLLWSTMFGRNGPFTMESASMLASGRTGSCRLYYFLSRSSLYAVIIGMSLFRRLFGFTRIRALSVLSSTWAEKSGVSPFVCHDCPRGEYMAPTMNLTR